MSQLPVDFGEENETMDIESDLNPEAASFYPEADVVTTLPPIMVYPTMNYDNNTAIMYPNTVPFWDQYFCPPVLAVSSYHDELKSKRFHDYEQTKQLFLETHFSLNFFNRNTNTINNNNVEPSKEMNLNNNNNTDNIINNNNNNNDYCIENSPITNSPPIPRRNISTPTPTPNWRTTRRDKNLFDDDDNNTTGCASFSSYLKFNKPQFEKEKERKKKIR